MKFPASTATAADHQAGTSKLAALVGVGRKKLRMGAPEEVAATTGYAVGGVSPVGSLMPRDIVVDESLGRFDTVWAAAGAPNAVFEANTAELVAKVNGRR